MKSVLNVLLIIVVFGLLIIQLFKPEQNQERKLQLTNRSDQAMPGDVHQC